MDFLGALGDVFKGIGGKVSGIFGGGSGSKSGGSALAQLGHLMMLSGQLLGPEPQSIFPPVRQEAGADGIVFGGIGRRGQFQSTPAIDPSTQLYLALYMLGQLMNRAPREPLPGPPVGISPDYGYGPGYYTPMLPPR